MSMMDPPAKIFSPDLVADDRMYLRIRDEAQLSWLRDRLVNMWATYSPYADDIFVQELARQFHPRFWEMYLTCWLVDHGYAVEKAPRGAPDIYIPRGSSAIWIEATAPTGGTGADAMEPISSAGWVREDRIVLRFQNSISEKMKAAERYIQKGIVGRHDPFVIAVNGCSVPHAASDDELPYAVQAVVPFGLPSVVVSNSGEVLSSGYEHRMSIRKASGSEVSTELFEDEAYGCVSGVLYSNTSAFDVTSAGCDFVFTHNHNANNPLPLGWLPHGSEYRLDGSTLLGRRWT